MKVVLSLWLAVASRMIVAMTSPFFMFSSSELIISSAQLQTNSSIESQLLPSLELCPSEFYIFAQQAGVNGSHYASNRAAPELAKRLNHNGKSIRSSASIGEVVGEIEAEKLISTLERSCGAHVTNIDTRTGILPSTYDTRPKIIHIQFTAPSGHDFQEDLKENDAFLGSVLDLLPSQNVTLMYITSPGSPRPDTSMRESEYEMDLQEALHLQSKRNMEGFARNQTGGSNQTMIDGPLFEKYQFFTPGIFMGFSVGILLLSILYVAISGISSLQVSYAAFDKEMGPKQQQKQQ